MGNIQIFRFFIFFVYIFAIGACDFGIPNIHIDTKNLAQNELGRFIGQNYPNKNEDELRKIIYDKLKDKSDPEELKKVVLKMGMECDSELKICECKCGYLVTTLDKGNRHISYSKHDFSIIINYEEGINSLVVNRYSSPISK